MLKRLILVLALLVGALAITQGPSQAAPLGASAHAPVASSEQVTKAQYYYYRGYRPRRFYGPRFYRPRYYRPRYYGGPRYFRPRYYRPRFYRYY